MIALFTSKSNITAPAPIVRSVTVEERRIAFKAARRHSILVKVLKWVLPMSAGIGIGIFTLFIQGPEIVPQNVSITNVAVESGKLVMVDPVMDGFTKDQKPYRVTAKKALQDVLDPNMVELQQMQATLPFADGKTAVLTAVSGIMDNDNNILTLSDGVEVVADDGMVVKLKNAIINIGDGTMQTKDPVDIKREGMAITADQMQVESGGKNLIFQDRVRVTLDANSVRRADGSANE